MHHLLSERLWSTLSTFSSKSGPKMAAISYVTSDKYVMFDVAMS